MGRGTKLFIIGAGLALMVVIGSFLIYQSLVFRLVSVSPKGQRLGTQENIVFHFNKDVKSDVQKQITISPKTPITITVQAGDIRISPQNTWNKDTKYTIQISQVVSVSGSQLANLSHNFTAIYKDFSQLSGFSQKLLIQDSNGSQLVSSDVLRKSLPHYELEYTIDYKSTSGTKSSKPYYLIIDTSIGDAFRKDDSLYKTEAERIRNLAIDYLQSNGIKSDEYPIYYSTPILQSLYGTYSVY